MAYGQGYYQAPQRPYNGRAAQPPSQAYGQSSYPPAAQGDFGYDDFGNGNAYAQNYDGQYQQPSNNDVGRSGGRGQYTPQNQGYPPQQEYYNNGGGRGRGQDPRAQNMNSGRGGGAPYPRPPISDSARGGYDNRSGGGGRGYPSGNGGPAMGRGGRPAPLDRSASSDPGPSQQRRQIAPDPLSPQEAAWDTPFPAFPGTKKKTSVSEEQNIVQRMASMDMNEPRRPKGGSTNGSDPGWRGPPGTDAYGRPSGESQRGMTPRGYPPQAQAGYEGLRGQRLGPGTALGNGKPQPNGYGAVSYDQGYSQPSSTPTSPIKDSFGPPSRSMTMPSDMGMNASFGLANGTPRYPQQGPLDGPGPSAPYNGPIGRGPPRAMTANGSRPPPHRTYLQEPSQQLYQNVKKNLPAEESHSHQQKQSISDFYDAYYEPPPQSNGVQAGGGNPSFSPEMPDFDNVPIGPGGHQRGMSDIEDHLYPGNHGPGPMPPRQQVNGYPLIGRTKSQPDFRAQVQPQSAVYEMAGDAPPLPSGPPQQGYPNGRYDQYGNQGQQAQNSQKVPPMERDYDGSDRSGLQGYGQPVQGQNGLASWSLPSGLSPHNTNGPTPARTNSLPQRNPDVLPSHPVPIRPGLIPNSVANQANNKPPPIRNYGNNNIQATSSQGQPAQSDLNDHSSGPPPVTLDELERLKVLVKNDPNDQATQLTLTRKYVEASEVLISTLPDQRSRNKARERYVFDAHKLLKKLVAVQNAEAMFYLADCYGRGSLGLETDNKEAFSLYQSAAKAGHAAAAYRMAVCCELGNEEGGGTRKDPLKAVQWYKRAATLGDTPAMYKMGMIQLKGLLGQPQNPREAIVWLKRAAERADAENPHALHELGLLHESVQPADGSGVVIRDEAYALSLFTQAAELGYKFSQFRLGSAYEYGLFNLKIDPRLSIMWYSRAAVQEEHQSELALSGWYLTGSEDVLQQSDTEAYLWARKAAIAGLAKAEYAMGYFTEVGIGSPPDLEAAKRWYWRAAAQNYPKARERLEDLKKGGSKPQLKSRERISRSKVGKQNEGECAVM